MDQHPLHRIDPAVAATPQNRRRPSRLPFLRFVTYDLGASETFDGNGQKGQAAAINVSEGGLCLLVNHLLREADIIRVELPLADVATTSATLAEVKWSKAVPWSQDDSPQYFVGIQFLL